MREFIRSCIDRVVWVNTKSSRKPYRVRQPTVYEALSLLTAISGAAQGEDSERRWFFDTLSGWLPPALYSLWTSRDYPIMRVVAHVFMLVNEGVPDFKAHKARMDLIYGRDDDTKEEPDEDSVDITPETLSETANLPWETYVADYMAAYGISAEQVLQERWNTFLFMIIQMDRIVAQKQIARLQTNSMPYIENEKERKNAVNVLFARAGGEVKTEAMLWQEKLDAQEEQLKQVEKQFAAFQPNLVKDNAGNEIRD